MLKAKVSVTANFQGLEVVRARLKALKSDVVFVGVPEGPHYAGGESVAQVLAWNEYGTATAPERPALRTGIRRAMPDVVRLNKANLPKVIDGRMSAGVALAQIGELGKSHVQKAIIEGPWAPNAPSTIRKKKSARPLVDTGQLRQSITYRVTPAGAGK